MAARGSSEAAPWRVRAEGSSSPWLYACVCVRDGAGRDERERWGSGETERRDGLGPWRLGLGLGGPRGWAAGGRGGLGRLLLGGPAGPAGVSLFSLSLISFSRKELERRKRKIGLGKEFAHGDYFPGITKMRLIQEK